MKGKKDYTWMLNRDKRKKKHSFNSTSGIEFFRKEFFSNTHIPSDITTPFRANLTACLDG